jgi:hypothetical protein
MSDLVLGYDQLGRIVGRTAAAVEAALDGFALPALRYREAGDGEADRIAAELEDTLRNDPLRRSGDDDPSVWIKGWEEVAQQLKQHPITLATLRPQYFQGEHPCRLFGRYVYPVAPDFEYNLGLAVRRIIFDEFLGSSSAIAEFGCGTGINLLLLAAQFPTIGLIGADWAPVCQAILAKMARQTGRDIKGKVFNMLTATGSAPDATGLDTTFLTVHAMEQLGTGWGAFADFLMSRRPRLCLHVEPFIELYDERSPFDDRARRYHLKRGYLQGFYPHVLALCQAGKGELLASRRVAFGGLYHEAYSILAWRPKD